YDTATPGAVKAELAAGVYEERMSAFGTGAHLAPAEAPDRVTGLILDLGGGATAARGTRASRQANAMTTRRAVLRAAHVNGAIVRTTAFTADFQDLITGFAWGEVWGRPGLYRRMRSVGALTALIAGGHWEEFPMHV